jgi:DNA uptake protein ComE-like DNA-binding protein
MMAVGRSLDRRCLLAAAASLAVVMLPGVRPARARDATPVVAARATKRRQWFPAPRPLMKLDLNAATLRQFIDVPGVGPAQARRFVANRPYVSIVDFRERIGATDGAEQAAAWEAWLYVPVDPNLADVPTLMQIPGVSEDVAIALMAARPYPGEAVFLEALAAVTEEPADLPLAARYLLPPAPIPVATPAT